MGWQNVWNEYRDYGGWPFQKPERVPLAERCWKCDTGRIHEGCAAELCGGCCAELRRLSA